MSRHEHEAGGVIGAFEPFPDHSPKPIISCYTTPTRDCSR
jgi:hypothetical protein